MGVTLALNAGYSLINRKIDNWCVMRVGALLQAAHEDEGAVLGCGCLIPYMNVVGFILACIIIEYGQDPWHCLSCHGTYSIQLHRSATDIHSPAQQRSHSRMNHYACSLSYCKTAGVMQAA